VAPPAHPSPIVPVVLGSEQAAIDASATLLDDGLWVPAIRPPTVPAGTSRLRVTLSAAHRDDDVNRLVDALVALEVPTPAAATAH
jgi:8-amino-7-oxononanoate synthase